MVDGSSRRDIKENSAYEEQYFNLPKIYVKNYYSVSCAIHARVVRARSSIGRAGAKGDRYKRYTTKLRSYVNTYEAITGTAALPLGDQSKLRLKFFRKVKMADGGGFVARSSLVARNFTRVSSDSCFF